MKTYTASQELVDILLKNGFIETTEKNYPEHFKRMKKDGYKHSSMKRSFAINPRSRDYILLDYYTIIPYYKSTADGVDMNHSLTEDQLKSIIVFYKMSSKYSWYIKQNRNIIDLHYHNEAVLKSNFRQTIFDKNVVELFKTVILC